MTSLLIGLCCFLLFGLCHPLVVKMEYYWGIRSWKWLFIPSIILIIISFFIENLIGSIVVGVVGFSLLWTSFEIRKQHERVLQGRAKKNPNRTYDE